MLLTCSTTKLAVLHGSSTTLFQGSRYCHAKVEFNSINLVRHGSSTKFETGLSKVHVSNNRSNTDYDPQDILLHCKIVNKTG